MKSDIEFVKEHITVGERLAQLAEECAELGQAVLKYRRVCEGKNPTPVTMDAARENVLEEIADVLLCVYTTEFDTLANWDKMLEIMSAKAKRWAQRIRDK